MLGINRSNIIICTGLICALLSYAEWAQILDSLGTHLPLVWNWAKVQKFLVTTYSDLPSGLCALSSMDYIHLPNGISRHFCVSGKKPRKQNENLLSVLTRRMVVRAARGALALAAEPGLPALPAVCLLEEAMYSFRPAICLTLAFLTGARDVPKLLLGSVSSNSRRKSGLQKTCFCLWFVTVWGRRPAMQNWWLLQRYLRLGHLYEEETPLLKINGFQINIAERTAFFPPNTTLCVAVLEMEEYCCFICQCSPIADLDIFVVFPAK